MIKVISNDFMRNGEKIGWIREDYIYDRTGHKLGYVTSNDIYNASGTKIGWIENNYLHATGGKKFRLEEVHSDVQGGALTEEERGAVRLLLGE